MEQTMEQRIYIGNLPKDANLSHLSSILPPGYDKSNLEIRHNYDIDKNIKSSYAFLNLKGTQAQIKTWCDNASRKSLGGNVLQVQFAKLSFLERLKQEVNSQKQMKDSVSCDNVNLSVKPYRTPVPNPNLVRFNSDQSSGSSDNEDEVCETESVSKVPEIKLNCNEDSKENISSKAEIKRMESLRKRNNAHVNKQKIIRMAIKTMTKGPSNKIVFHDEDDENSDNLEKQGEENNKRKLFEESDSDNEENLEFPVVQPKSKLIRTQISAVDERFRLDSRFFDDNEEKVAQLTNNETPSGNEQGKLLKIADSIIENDTNVKPKVKNKKDIQTIVPTRFNPLEKKHQSLVIKRDEDIVVNEQKKKPAKIKPFKVEKDRFYEVSDNLKEQFKKSENESTTFSLLGLFGGSTEAQKSSEPSDVKVNDQCTEDKSKILNFTNPLISGVPNFFNVDEQSDSDGENTESNKDSGKSKIKWNEPLFLPLHDPRIEEALKFFNTPLEETLPHAVISRDLKNIVKKKYLRNIAKAKQFKTKLGSRRKFHVANENKKKKRRKGDQNINSSNVH